jgi:hypothetical protein
MSVLVHLEQHWPHEGVWGSEACEDICLPFSQEEHPASFVTFLWAPEKKLQEACVYNENNTYVSMHSKSNGRTKKMQTEGQILHFLCKNMQRGIKLKEKNNRDCTKGSAMTKEQTNRSLTKHANSRLLKSNPKLQKMWCNRGKRDGN